MPPLDCALAGKYRRRLRLLPAEYRSVHEEEMLHVLLESARDADPENADLTYRLGSPGWRETSALVALALRLRWAPPADGSRFAARAAGLRLFTSAAVVLLAALSLQRTVSAIMLLVQPPAGWELHSLRVSLWQTLVPTDDWWLLARSWVHLGWIAALVLLGIGSRRAVRIAIVLAALPTTVLAVEIINTIRQVGAYGIASSTGWLAVELTAVAGLVAVASYTGSVERFRAASHCGAVGRGDPATAARPPQSAPRTADRSSSEEFAQPQRLRRHLAATGMAALLGIAYIVAAIAVPLPTAAYFIAVPITDMSTFFSLVSLVVAAAALARRSLPRPAAYALAGLASAAAVLQATTLDMWIVAARNQDLVNPPYAPYGNVGLAMAIAALVLDIVIAVVAATLARRIRVRS